MSAAAFFAGRKSDGPAGLARKVRRAHFVGIGGVGMSGIAEVLRNMGFEVSGSDIRSGPAVERLESLGCSVRIGHEAGNAVGSDVVVVSSAVSGGNPEVAEARRCGIPVIPRAEMLGELMRMKYSVAVAGSHGKTTTTSMAAVVLHHAGLDPTAIIGGRLNIFGGNARLGSGEFLVAEADESDGSFSKLYPTLAVVTNIDAEHLRHFGDMGRLQDAFASFANGVPFYGAAILCWDDPRTREILSRIERRAITYGFGDGADVRGLDFAQDGEGSTFSVSHSGRDCGPFRVCVPGRFNASNALAAAAVGLELGLDPSSVRDALGSFRGVDRRFQTRGVSGRGVRVVDDYAHHPTEIMATLEAARWVCRGGRVVALFQPHRFSRVRDLWDEFSRAFCDADVLIGTEIYPAGEAAIPGVTGERLMEAVRECGHPDARFAASMDALVSAAADAARPGDLVVTMGAGSVTHAGDRVLKLLDSKGGEP